MSREICTFLLLLLGLTLPVLSDRCPDHDRLPNSCQCEDEFIEGEVDVELSCSGSTLRELTDALRLMDKLSRLGVHLEDMKLGYLPSVIFYGTNVVRLDISHCEMDALAPPGKTALHGLEEKLEELFITGIYSFDKRPTTLPSISHLRRLRELEFSENFIVEVSDDWFSSPPPSLRQLTFSKNGIRRVGDRAFENIIDLEYLNLQGNRFGPVKRSMLPNKLKYLELDNNFFESVPDDLFTDMTNLKVLSLAENAITYLQERAFKPIWSQLKIFDGRGNPLECDSTMEWLFHVKTDFSLLFGTCAGPLGREGIVLKDFIENKGQ